MNMHSFCLVYFFIFYSQVKINSSKNHKNKTECTFKVVKLLMEKNMLGFFVGISDFFMFCFACSCVR